MSQEPSKGIKAVVDSVLGRFAITVVNTSTDATPSSGAQRTRD